MDSRQANQPAAATAAVVLIVPERHVKTVKSKLEGFNQLDKNTKITPATPEDENQSNNTPVETVAFTPKFPTLVLDFVTGQYVSPSVLDRREQEQAGFPPQQRMRVPTTIPYDLAEGQLDEAARSRRDQELRFRILDDLLLSHIFEDTALSYRLLQAGESTLEATRNPIHKALTKGLCSLPDSDHPLSSLGLTPDQLVSAFPESYSVYKPMLLLPHNAFASQPWRKLLFTHPARSDHLRPVWQCLAEAVGATHVAINAPIPPQTSPASEGQNILRSPVNLDPLYGDFGPAPTAQTLSSPTQADFASQLWVTTTQNGIQQTWAPRFTMFSRGNMGEKTRILNLASTTTETGNSCAAADLYAGVGYFAFSYKKGGTSDGKQKIKRVLCWELNPWSVEGLRRGAELNGWTCAVFTEDDVVVKSDSETLRKKLEQGSEADFWVFQMSNEHAERIVSLLAGPENNNLSLPIRHVNLGLLPTSKASWPAAVRILSQEHGGWIHVHENVGTENIESRTREVESIFQGMLSDGASGRKATVEHAEKVKMYAPGVMHVVFDVHVTGALGE